MPPFGGKVTEKEWNSQTFRRKKIWRRDFFSEEKQKKHKKICL